jgi:formylglycine-generating enzyme required for sulfatase activity
LETERLGFSLVYDDVSRVIRGGGWNLASRFARVAFRNALAPAYRNDALGFRLCVDWREG